VDKSEQLKLAYDLRDEAFTELTACRSRIALEQVQLRITSERHENLESLCQALEVARSEEQCGALGLDKL
jgi:hypothetical protein